MDSVRHHRFLRFLAAPLGVAAAGALAQTPPDAGRILRETRPPVDAPAISLPPIQAPTAPRPAVPAVPGDVCVQVTHFDFTGNSALSADTLRAAVAPWAGRALNFGELIQAVEAVEAVEARYKDAGYFLAQGYAWSGRCL